MYLCTYIRTKYIRIRNGVGFHICTYMHIMRTRKYVHKYVLIPPVRIRTYLFQICTEYVHVKLLMSTPCSDAQTEKQGGLSTPAMVTGAGSQIGLMSPVMEEATERDISQQAVVEMDICTHPRTNLATRRARCAQGSPSFWSDSRVIGIGRRVGAIGLERFSTKAVKVCL